MKRSHFVLLVLGALLFVALLLFYNSYTGFKANVKHSREAGTAR